MPTLAELRRMREQGGGVTTPTAVPDNPYAAAFKRQMPTQDETEGRGALEATLDYVSRPQRALVGGIRGTYKDDLGVWEGIKQGLSGESQAGFKDVLNDAGVDGKAATYGGMALDMVIDPLNFLPVGAIGKVAKLGGKGIRAFETGAKVLDKVGDIKKVAMSSKLPRVFNAYSGLEPEVAKAVRMAQAETRTTAERVIEDLMSVPGSKAGTSKLDEIAMEDLKKLIGSQKHQQTEKAIAEFAKTVKPGQYKDLVEVGSHEGLSAVKRQRLAKYTDMAKDVPQPNLAKGKGSGAINSPLRAARKAELDALDAKRLADAEKFDKLMVPKEFLESLQQAQSKFELPKSMRKIDSTWKEMATVWNPRFHVNNAVGNLWNMAINNPDRLSLKNNPIAAYMKGNKFISKINKGTLSAEEAKLSEALKRYGVDTGLTQHINYDPNSNIEAVRESAKRLGAKGNWATQIRKKVGSFGDRSERAAKIGTVIQELDKGKNLDDAILHAKDTLFDYQELTPEMRVLRDTVAPFLTFKLKNTALQPKGLLKHPELFAAVGKGRQDIEREAKTKGTYVTDKERYPADVLNAVTSLPIKAGGNPVSFRNPLPIGDLNAFSALDPFTRSGDLSRRALLADTAGPLPQIAGKLVNIDIRRPGQKPQPPEGLFGRVPANPMLQTLTPEMFNTHRNRQNPKATELRIPYILNEVLNQFPLANSLGRAALSVSDPELANDPLAALAWAGLPISAVKPESRKSNKMYNQRDYSAVLNSLKKKDRERIK